MTRKRIFLLGLSLILSLAVAETDASLSSHIPPALSTETPLMPLPIQLSHQSSTSTDSLPTNAPLGEREIVQGPAQAQPTEPTQMSPVMTLQIDGAQVIYTQTFPAVPDQWPAPSSGRIGLGTKMAQKRSEETGDAVALSRLSARARCRTLRCLAGLEGKGEE